jgi:hypothetical protein
VALGQHLLLIKPRVLCVASPDWFGISRIPRLLAQAGCHTTILTDPRNMSARSRWVDVRLPGTCDPAENLERLRLHLATGAAYDWIMLADDPTMVEGVRRCREAWCRGWFPVDPATVDPKFLIHKTLLMTAALAPGLPVPQSITTSTADEIRAAASVIGFPVLVKPAVGTAGAGIFTAGDAGELEARMPSPGSFVVQAFIKGRVGGTLVLFDHGRPLWWQNSLRVRVWPEPYGPSCQRRSISHPVFAVMVEKLGALLNMTGLGEIEWIMPDDGGSPVLIEFNPRPPPYTYLAGAMGADLPEAIASFLAGAQTTTPPLEGPVGPIVRLFPQDVIRAIESRDWKACALWLTGMAGPLPWNDPPLFLSYARKVLRAVARSVR